MFKFFDQKFLNRKSRAIFWDSLVIKGFESELSRCGVGFVIILRLGFCMHYKGCVLEIRPTSVASKANHSTWTLIVARGFCSIAEQETIYCLFQMI